MRTAAVGGAFHTDITLPRQDGTVCSTAACECERLAELAAAAIRNQTDTVVQTLLDRVDDVKTPEIVGRAPTMGYTQRARQVEVRWHGVDFAAPSLLTRQCAGSAWKPR